MRRFVELILLVSAVCGFATSPALSLGSGTIRPVPAYVQPLGEPSECMQVSSSFDGDCFRALGTEVKAAIQSGRHGFAAMRLTQMLSIQEHADLYNDRAMAHAYLGRFDEALADAAKAILMNPHLLSSHSIRTNVLVHVGRFKDALASVERWIAYAPDDVNAWSIRARMFRTLGNNNEAFASVMHINALRSMRH